MEYIQIPCPVVKQIANTTTKIHHLPPLQYIVVTNLWRDVDYLDNVKSFVRKNLVYTKDCIVVSWQFRHWIVGMCCSAWNFGW